MGVVMSHYTASTSPSYNSCNHRHKTFKDAMVCKRRIKRELGIDVPVYYIWFTNNGRQSMIIKEK